MLHKISFSYNKKSDNWFSSLLLILCQIHRIQKNLLTNQVNCGYPSNKPKQSFLFKTLILFFVICNQRAELLT